MLDQEKIAEIAARYGFEPTDRVVIENVEDANGRHGKKSPSFDGNLRRFWDCDASGHYVAEKILDGWLKEEARVSAADCDSIGRFHEAAYGD